MDTNEESREIDLMQYWRVILYRKWLAITFASAVVLFTAIFTFTATPIYQATAQLLIEAEASKILNEEDILGYNRRGTDTYFFNTQLALLKSRTLAEQVVEKLDLAPRSNTREVIEPKKNLYGVLVDIVSLKWLKSQGSNSGNEVERRISVNPFSMVAQSVADGLRISPVRNTNLVNISYSGSSPEFTANLVNTYAREYINFSFEKRSENTRMAYNYYDEQIANLTDMISEKRRELQRYRKDKDIIPTDNADSTTLNRVSELTSAYWQARMDSSDALTNYTSLKNLDINTWPHSVENPIINSLYTDYSDLNREYENELVDKEPEHIDMRRLKAKLDNAKNDLQAEIEKAILAAEQEHIKAVSHENTLKRMLDRQVNESAETADDTFRYRIIQMDITNMQKTMDSYSQRREQIRPSANLEGMKPGTITIVDTAQIPQSPISPQKRKNLILALLIGVFGGVGLCFLVEYLDNSVKGPDDVKNLTGLPSLGVIPYLPPEGISRKKRGLYLLKYLDYYSYGKDKPSDDEELVKVKKIELINHMHPQFFISEDYRTIRTSILFSEADNPPKTLLITSALPQEGKTTTSTNIAVAFSQLAEKVLIIDADLRKPRLHQVFEVNNVGGLSSYLAGKTTLRDSIKMSAIQNIWLLPSGPIPPNPAELLNSQKMKEMLSDLSRDFDIILLDSPPVLAAIDTVVLASSVDKALIVVSAGKTPAKVFQKAVLELNKARSNLIGAVLNGVRVDQGAYYYKDYYHYGQTYSNEK